jgi:hypothetical protein
VQRRAAVRGMPDARLDAVVEQVVDNRAAVFCR